MSCSLLSALTYNNYNVRTAFKSIACNMIFVADNSVFRYCITVLIFSCSKKSRICKRLRSLINFITLNCRKFTHLSTKTDCYRNCNTVFLLYFRTCRRILFHYNTVGIFIAVSIIVISVNHNAVIGSRSLYNIFVLHSDIVRNNRTCPFRA